MRRLPVVLTVTLLFFLGCSPGTFFEVPDGPTTPAPTGPQTPKWVGAWGDAIDNNLPVGANQGGHDRSFRSVVTPTIGGTMERVRFSNYFGTTPVRIGAARLAVAIRYTSHIRTGPLQDVALTFNGQGSVTIGPGEVVTSDPATMTFDFGQTLAISVYMPGNFGPVARHDSIFVKNYQVYPKPNSPGQGQYGDRPSDWLARRFVAAGYRIGVVNLGIPGDTVTADIVNQQNHTQNANDRVGHDLLTLPNLLATLTYFGSIDIRSPDCMSARAIEAATAQMVATIHAAKVPVVLATIPPSAFCTNPSEPNYGPFPSASSPYAGGRSPGPSNPGEAQRVVLNDWIRASGAKLAGVTSIADFDAAMMDPTRPDFLLPQYNSGDNYHPNGNGYHRESDTFPLGALPPPPK